MTLLLQAAAALLAAHLLPGALLVRCLGLGRCILELFVLAAVLGGPCAAFVYWLSLLSGSEPLYWILLGLVDLSAAVVLARGGALRRPLRSGVRREILLGLLIVVALTQAAYFTTTGHLFRRDAAGDLVMDRALQRDTLFHVGIVRSLTSSYPAELLSISGTEARYHSGYHLQLAAWCRFFGIDAFDGVYRIGAGWSLALLVLSGFFLARRFTGNDAAALLVTMLLFGSGLGYLFAPAEGWWSLAFMDAAIVSIFLPNPLLPALSLAFIGLGLLADHLESGRRGALIGAALCLASVLAVKVFLGVQIIAGMTIAAALSRAGERRRLLRATAVVGIAAAPLVLLALAASRSGNTAVSLRPFEMVRYSMEVLGWKEGREALVRIGGAAAEIPLGEAAGVAALAVSWWAIAFLGLRLVGLTGMARDLGQGGRPVGRVLAFTALVGFPAALLLRIAPADAAGLSRWEGVNESFWFATQSGILLWFWTGEAMAAFSASRHPRRKILLAGAGCVLALPSTIQHFAFQSSLDRDVIPAAVVAGAEEARGASAPGEVWVEPPDRAHPSPVAYLAGRPVVHDGYVGYDYMFVPREERDFRRHAVAQFWSGQDPYFADWFLERYRVAGVFATHRKHLSPSVRERVELVFSNDAVRLYRVTPGASSGGRIVTPARLPLGTAGAAYFGNGWGLPSGSPRRRLLPPGEAQLYLPLEAGVRVELTLHLRTPHASGEIALGGNARPLGPAEDRVTLTAWPEERGLARLGIRWTGATALIVEAIATLTVRTEQELPAFAGDGSGR